MKRFVRYGTMKTMKVSNNGDALVILSCFCHGVLPVKSGMTTDCFKNHLKRMTNDRKNTCTHPGTCTHIDYMLLYTHDSFLERMYIYFVILSLLLFIIRNKLVIKPLFHDDKLMTNR